MDRLAAHRRYVVGSVAPALMIAGVAVVLLAQLWPALPVAAAVAVTGWGSSLAVGRRPLRLMLTAAVYASLVLLAVAAQLDAAERSGSTWRLFFAAVDAGAAMAITLLLARRAAREKL